MITHDQGLPTLKDIVGVESHPKTKEKLFAEREVYDQLVHAAEETLEALRQKGLTRPFKELYWEGPIFEETMAVDLSEEVLEKLRLLGYAGATQAYLIRTGSYGEVSNRGIGSARVADHETDYTLRILTGDEFDMNTKNHNPDLFLGRGFATLSLERSECSVSLNPRINTELQGDESELAVGSTSQEAIGLILAEINAAPPPPEGVEPKFVASSL